MGDFKTILRKEDCYSLRHKSSGDWVSLDHMTSHVRLQVFANIEEYFAKNYDYVFRIHDTNVKYLSILSTK